MLVFFIIGIFLAFFLAFLIFTKKDKRISDRILFAWMVVIGLQLLGYYTYSLGNWHAHPHTIGIAHPLPLAQGPFLYLLILYTIKKKERFCWKDYLHFAPVLLMYIYMLPFFLGHSGNEKIQLNVQVHITDSVFMLVSKVMYIFSGFSYLTLSFYLLKHRRQSSGNDDIGNLFALHYYLACGVCAVFMLAAILYMMQEVGIIPVTVNVEYIIYSGATLCLLFLCVYTIRNTSFLSVLEENEDDAHNFYAIEEEVDLYVDRLSKVMNLQKPYLDPDLNAETLSALSCVPKRSLSIVIKKFGFNNFNDFVNSYRIAEFKRKIEEPYYAKFDIFSVAYDSGFRARSTFYDNFKRLTGETPSAYIKKRAKRDNSR